MASPNLLTLNIAQASLALYSLNRRFKVYDFVGGKITLCKVRHKMDAGLTFSEKCFFVGLFWLQFLKTAKSFD